MIGRAHHGQETASADGLSSDRCRNRHRGDRCEGDCRYCADDATAPR